MSALLALAGRAFADDDPADEPEGLVDVEDLGTDGEVARSSAEAGAQLLEEVWATTSGLIDVQSFAELESRHHRPSRWGRIDFSITWRRTEPDDGPPRKELWLLATWSH